MQLSPKDLLETDVTYPCAYIALVLRMVSRA